MTEIDTTMPDPAGIASHADLLDMLAMLRQRAARGTQKAKVSLDEIARRSGIPRSTAHAYLVGRLLPPADALDAILVALGVPPRQLPAWAEALYRLPESRAKRSAAAAAAAAGKRAPRLLPPPPRGFVGREEALVALTLRLEGDGGLVVAVGPGGIGKTSLVLEWAHRNLAKFPDGQLYADLRGFSRAAPADPGTVASRFLAALGVPADNRPGDPEALLDLLRSELADRRMLIFLDNARNAAQVRPLLPGSPSVSVIVTSRDDMRPLVVREGAYRLMLPSMTSIEGVPLLRVQNPGLTVLDAERIVGRCAGLPLALRIVADRLSAVGPERLLTELDDSARALDAVGMVDEGVDSGVRGVLMSSYRALPEQVQQLFRSTGALAGPWLCVPVLALLTRRPEAEVRAHLDALVATHLLLAVADGYQRHDLVNAFAHERLLAEDGQECLDEMTDRAVDAYVAVLDQVLTQMSRSYFLAIRPSPPPTTQVMDPELLLREEASIADLLTSQLRRTDGLSRAARLAEGWSRLALELGRAGGLGPVLQLVVDRARDAGNHRDEAAVAIRLASIYAYAQGVDQARAMFARAAEAAGQASWLHLQSAALAMQGSMLNQAARFTEAVETFTRARELAQSVGDQESVALATMHLAETLRIQGRPEAEQEFAKCLDFYREMERPDGMVFTQLDRASVAEQAGDLDAAAAFIASARELRGDMELAVIDGPMAYEEGMVAVARGDLDTADRCLALALGEARESGNTELSVVAHILAGRIELRRGEAAEARGLLTEAVREADQAGFVCDEVRAGLHLAEAARLLGDGDAARRLLTRHGVTADRLGLQVDQRYRDRIEAALRDGDRDCCLF